MKLTIVGGGGFRVPLVYRALLEKVRQICAPRVVDPYAQRYHFWMHYADEHA